MYAIILDGKDFKLAVLNPNGSVARIENFGNHPILAIAALKKKQIKHFNDDGTRIHPIKKG